MYDTYNFLWRPVGIGVMLIFTIESAASVEKRCREQR